MGLSYGYMGIVVRGVGRHVTPDLIKEVKSGCGKLEVELEGLRSERRELGDSIRDLMKRLDSLRLDIVSKKYISDNQKKVLRSMRERSENSEIVALHKKYYVLLSDDISALVSEARVVESDLKVAESDCWALTCIIGVKEADLERERLRLFVMRRRLKNPDWNPGDDYEGRFY